MATTIALTSAAGTNAPYKLGSPPDFGTLYSGRALEFDGVSDYVSCDGVVSSISSNTIGTISFWFKSTSSSYMNFISASDWSDGSSNLSIVLNSGDISLNIRENGSYSIDATNSTNYNDGNWHHLAFTVDATGNKMYVDGSQITLTYSTGSSSTQFWFSGVNDLDVLTIGANKDNTTRVENYYDGELTNVQIWDKAWSLSDVRYAYTHPEKLITDNSAVTSGTTISNLKAWYPCTEGNPRSPQTTVYDGSEKGLGSELVTNGTFDDDSDWTEGTGWSIGSGVATKTAGTQSGLVQSDVFTSGKLYKLVFDVTVDAGNVKLWVNGTQNATGNISSSENNYTLIFTATATGTAYFEGNSSFAGTIDNVTVKEVQMGNHGTTTFYGDDLVEAHDAGSGTAWTGATGDTAPDGWSAQGSNRVYTIDSSSLKIASGAAGSAGIIWGGTTVLGRSYRAKFSYKNEAGTTLTVTTNEGATTLADSTSWTHDQTHNWVGDGGAGDFVFTVTTANKDGWIDNCEIKEVGVAAGWTTADAEPLIPQTALMGMSKPLVFDGVDDIVSMGDQSELDISTSDFSISWWMVKTSSGTIQRLVTKYGAPGWTIRKYDNEKINIYIRDDTTANASIESASALSSNKLYHIVCSFDRSSDCKIYINGSLDVTTSISALDGNSLDNAADFVIGGTNSQEFNGILGEVSMWTTALSLAEVQELFNDGVALDATTHSKAGDLVGYWRNGGAVTWSNKVLTSNVITINEGAEYSDSDVTLTVNNGALVSVNDVLVIDNEELLVTSISTHNLTVTRGYNGTTATAHDNGANISVYHNGTVAGSPDTILLPEGTTSGKDILGFPLTHTNNGWLNLSGSEYVDAGDSTVLDIQSAITIEAWIKCDDITAQKCPVGRDDLTNRNFFLLAWDDAKFYFYFYVSGSAKAVASTTSYTANTWFYVVGTYDGANQKLYINGALEDNDAETGNIDNDDVSLTIGALEDGGGRHFKGSLDEVRVYNRALSLAEVTKNYNHGKSKHS